MSEADLIEPGPPLRLAIPSKGRLQENAAAFFARAGLVVVGGGARGYRGTLSGVADVEVQFLSASEIVGSLAAGTAHLGVTGEDLVRETLPDAGARLALLTPLGFGNADVVVAVPQAWIDVVTMADLDEVAADLRARHGRRLRIATKYVNLTRRFFADHGIADYRIVESSGATEGAPAAGTAEIVVDITTTGATLRANALKVVDDGVILRSEANLVASLTAEWGFRARAAVAMVLGRIGAEERARTTRELRAAAAPGADLAAIAEPFGAALPYGAPAPGAEWVLRAPKDTAFALADALVAAGARGVTVRGVDYTFEAQNPLLDGLLAGLG